MSGFGQPRNPSEYTAEELAEVRSTAKLAAGLAAASSIERSHGNRCIGDEQNWIAFEMQLLIYKREPSTHVVACDNELDHLTIDGPRSLSTGERPMFGVADPGMSHSIGTVQPEDGSRLVGKWRLAAVDVPLPTAANPTVSRGKPFGLCGIYYWNIVLASDGTFSWHFMDGGG